MRLKEYTRNAKNRKQYVQQPGLLLIGVDISKGKQEVNSFSDALRIWIVEDYRNPCEPTAGNKYKVRLKKLVGKEALGWIRIENLLALTQEENDG